jgi:hypothetical protein
MKPPLPHIASSVPRLPHVQLEIAKAMHTLLSPKRDEAPRQRRTEIVTLRRDLELLTGAIRNAFEETAVLAKAELRAVFKKYSPDQPRVPAGNADGGQWMKEDDENRSSTNSTRPFRQISSGRSEAPVRYASLEISPSNVLTDAPGPGTQYAAGSENNENREREELTEASPGQLIRLDAAQGRLNELLSRVRKIDGNWSPQPGLYEGIEGRILNLEAQAQEAEAFLARVRDLGYARDLVTGRRIIWPPNTKTGNPLIDKTTDQLMELLGKVMDENGPRPDLDRQRYGILIHTEFANKLRAGVVPGVRPSDVERTFSLTEDKFYGAEDSVRGDYVLTRDDGNVVAFYDIKTGRGMSELQVIRLRYMSNSGRAIPVIQLNRERGAIFKRR